MGFRISTGITQFDHSDAAQAVAGTATVVLRTITGKGAATLVLVGDGSADVDILAAVDGGVAAVLATSDIASVLALGFSISLVLSARNNNLAARNSSGISSTGVMQ